MARYDAVVAATDTDFAGPTGRDRSFLFGEMLVFGILSLVASLVLSYDALLLAANPDAVLNCSINEVFDCAVVGRTWQAEILGFPNAFLGLVTVPVVITIAVAGICGVRFPKWFMVAANIGYLVGAIFAYWMLFQSTFVIAALCPWCLCVTLSMTFIFYAMTKWNILEGNLYLPDDALARLRGFVAGGWFTIGLIAWLALILVIELGHWLPRFL